jgi:ThiF family
VVAALALALSRIDPTLKIALDDGTAEDEVEAARIFRTYVLQVDVQQGAPGNRADEAALLTILNTAPRAFLGGVHVRIARDTKLASPWANGRRLSEVVSAYGGEVVSSLSDAHPTLVIGNPPKTFPTQGICLTVTHRGWCGGVLTHPHMGLPSGYTFPPAAIAAAAIAVAETFQRVRGGDARAARRDLGISLWRPGLDWKSPAAWGPETDLLLPYPLQVVGLGHLGQAALWSLGFLDYENPLLVYLQDYDVVAKENLATSMLTTEAELGQLKTRICADRLQALGMSTRLIERRLDENQRRSREEPQVLLSAFDNPAARTLLSGTGFDLIIDLGIGAGHRDFMDLRLYSFPASRRSEEVFPAHGAEPVDEELLNQPAWKKLHEKTQDRCGVIDVAGRAVGASFVGAFTSAVGVAELVRYYADDQRYELIDVSLRNVGAAAGVPVNGWEGAENLGYVSVS